MSMLELQPAASEQPHWQTPTSWSLRKLPAHRRPRYVGSLNSPVSSLTSTHCHLNGRAFFDAAHATTKAGLRNVPPSLG